MKTDLDLVIFDCDGVLVDSERLASEVFARALKEVCGLDFTLEEMFEEFVGHSWDQCRQKLESRLGHPPPEALARRYRDEVNLALAESVQPVSGIVPALRAITLPACVASSGSHDKMRITLGRTGLYQHFEGRIFSTSEVPRGKPHPDIYLYAADRMGASDPGRCAVVEDSPLGVEGARAAGMKVFGYAELMPAHKLAAAGADIVFHRMADLPRLLATHD